MKSKNNTKGNNNNLTITKNHDEDKIKYEQIPSNDKEITININDQKKDLNINDQKKDIPLKNNEITIIENNLFYNGYEYYRYKKAYIKKEFRNKNSIFFKCKNYRKNDNHRKGKGKFCYSEIIVFFNEENKIENNNIKNYQIIKDHSYE